MGRFSVWAPLAERVDVVLDGGNGERLPMAPAAEPGWWAADVPGAGPGTLYQYSLDGGPAFPDPRSASQPEGVHGPSEVVDHSAFRWTDGAWRGAAPLPAAVIYELHVGTFTPEGTFDAAAGRLGHLAGLGVTHVELLPVVEFPGERGWGYDGVDLFAPHHAYGGPEGLKGLVDAAHAAGLGVIIDVVYNHLGPDGNYLGAYGPYFTDRYGTPWGSAVNYDDAHADGARRFVVDNALLWLRDYHADGLRLDAVHAIFDASAVHILEEIGAAVRRLEAEVGRRFDVIAESDLNDPRLVRPVVAGGYGLDAAWSDDFHHALHSVLTGERDGYYEDFGTLADLAVALERVFVYDGCYSRHRLRRHGRPVTGCSGTQFVSFLQNHDQVGNRARGERSAELMSPGRLKIGAALVLCSPFVPMLFQGEEWAATSPFQYFTDHNEELGRLVSEGRRREFAAFGWDPSEIPDPQDPATFERSKLDWAEVAKEPHAGLLDWHRRLLALRRRLPALSCGDLATVAVAYDEEAQWLVLARGPAVRVVVNLAAEAQVVPLPVAGGPVEVLLASEDGAVPYDGGVSLPAESVAVVAVGAAVAGRRSTSKSR
jgi:maltooligosyltrehalose trehalohydrolase